MRVLLTTRALEHRAGSELYAADVAGWLRRHGHMPIVYAPRRGALGETIRARGIPVVDDLAQIAEPPDLIHAQHHLPTMAALAHFPQVPAVYVCHGWLPWEESPPRHPSIRRYVAVSEATRERLVSENGVAPDRVVVLPNFVDLSRFSARGSLPGVPRRALLFSNHANGQPWVDAIRAACESRGIELDVAGMGCGRPMEQPEDQLHAYDLVFARGRSALEAMASGAAVVLCDVEGLGPMVTPGNIDRLRAGNFGMQVMTAPHRAALVEKELDRYDPAAARQVTAIVRDVHDLDRVVGHLRGVYGDVLADEPAVPHSHAEALAAHATYAQWLQRTFPMPWLDGRADVERRLHDAEVQAAAVVIDRDTHAREMAAAQTQADALRAEIAALSTELATIRSGFLFRRVLPLFWKIRLRLVPNDSRRHRTFVRWRQRLGRALIRSGATPEHPAATATHVPDDARLSAVVLHVDGQPHLDTALRSLAAQHPRPEIVVVSSGGGGAAAANIVESTGVDATVIGVRTRLLPGGTRNVGIAATHEPVVAFLSADCVAEPGWVPGRLAAHAAGAEVVSSAVISQASWNPIVMAAHHLLFSARLPGTPPDARLHFGVSYTRALFMQHGPFRSDLRAGEDTEFNHRLRDAQPVFRSDVRTVHRHPAKPMTLLREHYERGWRAAILHAQIHGGPAQKIVASSAIRRLGRTFTISLRSLPWRDWPRFALALPWMPFGAAAYAYGAWRAPGVASSPAETAARRSRLLCIITFRNERRFLPGFLENIAPHVDGILALDDGSTDGSGDIVAVHPAVREVLRVEPRTPHVWDERRNRRLLVDAAGRHGAEWVIALDADERVERHFRERADTEIARAEREGVKAYNLAFRELWDSPDRYRADGVWGTKEQARLFRYRPDHDVSYRALHGQWAPDNSRLANGYWARADLIIYHLRMMTAEDRERRQQRYLRLDPDSRWQTMGYEYLTDERDLCLAPFPEGRGYEPLAIAESQAAHQFAAHEEAVAIHEEG